MPFRDPVFHAKRTSASVSFCWRSLLLTSPVFTRQRQIGGTTVDGATRVVKVHPGVCFAALAGTRSRIRRGLGPARVPNADPGVANATRCAPRRSRSADDQISARAPCGSSRHRRPLATRHIGSMHDWRDEQRTFYQRYLQRCNDHRCDELGEFVGAAFADAWSAIPKIVFSHTLVSVQGNARLAQASVAKEAAVALDASDKDVGIGGAGLPQQRSNWASSTRCACFATQSSSAEAGVSCRRSSKRLSWI